MSAPLREQYANNAYTLLNGAIDNSQTAIAVIDGSRFPNSGNFRLMLPTGVGPNDLEIMLCTARSGNTLTVVRGQEGTTAVTHPDGRSIVHILTKRLFSNDRPNQILAGFALLSHRNRVRKRYESQFENRL
jgi:hypothetical protein